MNRMRKLIDSDIFSQIINKGNRVLGQIPMILPPSGVGVMLNEPLHNDIKRKIVDKKRSAIATAILDAIDTGELILIYTPPEHRLSDMIPFIAFKNKGIRRVLVNFSSIVRVTRLNDGTPDYDLGENVNKAYVLLHSAYLTLEQFTDNAVMSADVVYDSAVLWAEMFNKPLFDVIGLNNTDRREAFMYLGMKFFSVYFMGCSEDQAEKTAMKYLKQKNQMLVDILDNIKAADIDIYAGVQAFLTTLLNDEITSIKGVKVNNMSNAVDISFYIRKFSQTYGSNALLSLCSYPYFIYAITAAMGKCNMVKDKSFERFLKYHQKIANKLVIEVQK